MNAARTVSAAARARTVPTVALLAALAVAAGGCASASRRPGGDVVADGGPSDGGRRRGDPRDAGLPDLPDAFVDDGCGDAGPAPDGGLFEADCDPFDAASCGPGLACYVLGAGSSDPCEPPRFTARCFVAGPGGDGAGCGGALDCRAGHHCFNTGRGNQCLPLCDLAGGDPPCPRGSVCRPTDLPGFGACF